MEEKFDPMGIAGQRVSVELQGVMRGHLYGSFQLKRYAVCFLCTEVTEFRLGD